MRGRLPKPAEIKAAEGVLRPRDAHGWAAGISAGAELVVPPPGLSERGMKYWPDFQAAFARHRVVKGADVLAVGQLIEVYAEYRQYQELVETEGATYWKRGPDGAQLKANPAVAMLASADARLRGWMAEFGITPSSRVRVHAPGDEAKDPLGDFL